MTRRAGAYKLKTKSAFKKRFRLTCSGGVKAYCACRRHKLFKNPKSSRQKLRRFFASSSDSVAVKRFLYR
ncbi:50S ribosomal protein L35 [Candidatus Hodgkinia cicadicola]|nr:50S ribosomal protein L35 [Candidatus Hodgkinia cicadicola]